MRLPRIEGNMRLPNDKVEHPQFADNWAFLGHPSLPTNVDGIFHLTQVDATDSFLFCEVKRGEGKSDGQNRMLLGLSHQKAFTVLVVNSNHRYADERNMRDVIPYPYQVVKDGVYGDEITTTPDDFKWRYFEWFKGKNRF
jgi:hypothetical protein